MEIYLPRCLTAYLISLEIERIIVTNGWQTINIYTDDRHLERNATCHNVL